MEPIHFVTPLEDQTVDVIPGEAKFECVITKLGVTAEWQRQGKKISSNGKYKITAEDGVHTLHIQDVMPEDECEYTVVFTPEVKTSAKLWVKGKYERTTCKYSSYIYIHALYRNTMLPYVPVLRLKTLKIINFRNNGLLLIII